ncbi:MAG: hypothetical protein ACXAC2_22795 [Candidatus Kariarchaeaceae archaeon]|jgi:hypothetical protein
MVANSGDSEHPIPESYAQFAGSSSLLGKHSDTMIMDFLATIATQRAINRLDLIDA